MKKVFLTIFAAFISATLAAQTIADTATLTLDQCRERALRHSREMQHADNSLQQAELMRKAMLTNFFPQVEGTAMGIYMQDQELANIPYMLELNLLMHGTYMCGFQLTQPLFAGGKIVNGYKLTQVGVEVSKEQQRQQRAQTIADVDKAYWTYVAVLSKVRLLKDYQAQLDTLLEQVNTSVNVGMATDYDQMQVRTARSNILYQLKRAQSGATLCRLSLSRMTGIVADSVFLIPDTAISSNILTQGKGQTLSLDFSDRPEMNLLRQQLKASELQVKMARADYLPTFGLALGYSWFGNMKMTGSFYLPQLGSIPLDPPLQGEIDKEFTSNSPMVMLSLKVPLTKWVEGGFKIKKAKLDVANSRLDLENNTELMRLEVQQAASNLEDSYELISAALDALNAATEQLRVTRNRYNVSLAPLSDLLDAQSKWQQAESDYLEARTQCLIYRTEYLRVTGGLE